MNILKRYGILASLMVLTSCSYFNTNEELSVSSKDLNLEDLNPAEEVVEDDAFKWAKVQSITRRKPKGVVEVYDLDLSEAAVLEKLAPALNERKAAGYAGALMMSPRVEIYPIDVSMQKTLKPVQ